MKTDIPSMAPPPPAIQESVVSRSGSILESAGTKTINQLQIDLVQVLQIAQPIFQLTDMADDDTPKIPSLVAVFLISQIGVSVGRPKLVNLSHVRPEDLRSVGGIARLVHSTLHPVSTERVVL
jgi:hypothetical protein